MEDDKEKEIEFLKWKINQIREKTIILQEKEIDFKQAKDRLINARRDHDEAFKLSFDDFHA